MEGGQHEAVDGSGSRVSCSCLCVCRSCVCSGKTLLAKAVANETSATFLRVVGSELIQKYLGDGPKLVRELFRVADEHAPSIVFIVRTQKIQTSELAASAVGLELMCCSALSCAASSAVCRMRSTLLVRSVTIPVVVVSVRFSARCLSF